jgi:hypothetical protein
MQKDWRDLLALLYGTATQQAAYPTLEADRVLPLPGLCAPMLAGTIPFDIAMPGRTLAIGCAVERGQHGGIR